MSLPLFNIIYSSSNRIQAPGNDMTEELKNLLFTSRANNLLSGITGVLLFSEENFAQILEGSQEAVTQLFDKILLDTRHSDILLLQSEPIAVRQFPEWSMAFACSPVRIQGSAETLSRLRELIFQEDRWVLDHA